MTRIQRPKECFPSRLAAYFRDHGYRSLFHILYGIESRIPLCCVAEFTYLRWRRPEEPTALAAGCQTHLGCLAHYVHCSYHRKKHHVSPRLARYYHLKERYHEIMMNAALDDLAGEVIAEAGRRLEDLEAKYQLSKRPFFGLTAESTLYTQNVHNPTR